VSGVLVARAVRWIAIAVASIVAIVAVAAAIAWVRRAGRSLERGADLLERHKRRRFNL